MLQRTTNYKEQITTVRTRIGSNPEQEWIQAHVAQTINL